ncbi:hypothetical protein IYY11_17045 [Methylocystis sp. H62]|uniref:hypothetical protein n=1 Tax=Methylocystis sp. H62 TaxID=2785789 RepID=UPI0018C31F4C|nr:hypothetical protein [Methylocystis sp. H62]MBG0795062.1 hypothetical protein [Methylocystis sp. H62]
MPKHDDLIIPLPPECMRRPQRIDLAILAGYMLWPHDRERRREYIDSAFVEFAPPGMYAEVFPLAKRTLPFSEVGKASQQMLKGVEAGNVLYNALMCKILGREDISQDQILDDIIPSTNMANKKKNFHATTWKNYSCVAHFWAAYINARKVDVNRLQFPCAVDYLPMLLKEAESFRRRGEQERWRQSTSKVLDATKTFKLPAELDVVPEAIEAF